MLVSTALVIAFIAPHRVQTIATQHRIAPIVSSAVAPAAEACVIGGGPAGLATAWTLATRGFDVTLIEKRPEPTMYEAQKAYLYLVDGRGQQFTDAAGLTEELASPSVSVSSTNYTVTRCLPDGTRPAVVPPILEATVKPSYWIPRQALLSLLTRALTNLPAGTAGSVRTLYGREVAALKRTDAGGVEVSVREGPAEGDGSVETLKPALLVGADGLSSLVRARCAEWSAADASLGAMAADFTLVELPSPSSGLLYKMLRLPPAFRLDTEDESATAEPRKAYSMRPSKEAPLGPTRLGLLPVADPSYPRTANVILPPEHPVWELESAEAVRGWLRETFPHLPTDSFISEDEAESFASERPGAFPAPCYSPRQHLLLPKASVALVGDAVHAFPPDIGQGVNAALSDVMMLSKALDDAAERELTSDDSEGRGPADAPAQARALLERALPAYGRACAPEAEAVVRIAQIGFPYQYPITREKSPLQRFGWFANFFARTFVLAKLAPKLFTPAAIVLVQRAHLSYAQAWALAGRTTRRMQAIGLVAALGAAWPWLRRLACV